MKRTVLISWVIFYSFTIYAQSIDDLLIQMDTLHDAKKVAEIHLNLGSLYRRKSSYDSSTIYYEMVRSYAEKNNDQAILGKYYNEMGVQFRYQIKRVEALEYLYKAETIFDSLDLKAELAKIYNDISTLYQSNDKEMAIAYLEKSLPLSLEIGDTSQAAITSHNLGLYKEGSEKLSYMNHSLNLFKQVGNALGIARTYQVLASIYTKDSLDYLKAIEYLEQSDSIYLIANRLPYRAANLFQLAKIYYAKGDYRQCRNRLIESQNIAKSINYTAGIYNTYHYLGKIDSLQGNYLSGLKNFNAYHFLKDSLQVAQREKEVDELRISYESEKKEKENLELKTQNSLNKLKLEKQSAITIGITTTAFLFLFGIILLIKQNSTRKRLNLELHKRNEKIELLMRELHHRVKNNLQIISSLLGLQSMKLQDESAKIAVSEGKERIRAMSLIHQKLYQHEEVTSLNIQDYITNLVDELTQSYGFSEKAKVTIEVPSISIDADTSLPIGLIVNELVSNAFKYAFKNIEEPILELKLIEEKNNLLLKIRDNGKGLPNEFNIENASSFGMKLVNLLVRQLKGSLEVNQKDGLSFNIKFKLT